MNQHDDSDLRADWSEAEMSVLRSAELDAPPHGAVERTLTAVGVGVGAALGAGLGTASSLSGAANVGSRMAHGSIWLKWLATAIVGGGIAGALLLHRQRAASTPSARLAPSVVLAPPAPATSDPEVVAAPAPSAGDALSVPTAAARLPAAPSSATPAPSRAESKDDLATEIRLIDEARARLRAGDATGSLATLAAYDQLVKRGGSMRAEATVVRIEAYQKSGDSARAAALGSRFVAQNPASPYAEYVKRILPGAN